MADRFRTPRKEKEWGFMPAISNSLEVAATTALTSLAFSSAATVMRMLGSYILAPNAATVAQDMASIVIGIGKVSTDAFAAGGGSLPDPAGEPDYPWLYWADHELFFGGTSTDPQLAASGARITFDIRSMRKFKPGESLAMVAQYVDIQGTPPIRVNVGRTRCLLAVH